MRKIIIITLVILVAGFLIFRNTREDSSEPIVQEEVLEEVAGFEEIFLDYIAVLEDVTGGDSIRGVSTNGSASGEATSGFEAGLYTLAASFQGLPAPSGTDFYEGWVVRQDPLDAVSTGRVEKNGDQFFNVFSSSEDLLDHTLYVLTLEPDDGDPAPADHILEGKFVKE